MSYESSWTWEENKKFEDYLVEFDEDYPDRWSIIAERLGTRTATEVKQHYVALLEDVDAIESGLIELPNYRPSLIDKQPWTDEEHRLFLQGLEIYGRKWKSISMNLVKTRTPTQVASYADKYFKNAKKERQDKQRN